MPHRPSPLRAALTVVALLASATAHAAQAPTSPAPISSTPAPISSTPAPISSTPAPISSTPAPISSTPAVASPPVTPPPAISPPAPPPIARTPPVAPPPAPRLRLRNPRADSRLSAALALYGATQGLGVIVEYMPHWVASFGLGLGGTARLINTTTPLAAGTVHAELNLLPIPFVVTPVIGGGFGVTFGPLAANLPGIAGRAPDRDQSIRLLPYARFGLRVELPRKFHIVGEVLLVPDNRLKQGHEIHPLPGLRIGLSVL